MDAQERQALMDHFICASIEAAEALHQALEDLKHELLDEEPDG